MSFAGVMEEEQARVRPLDGGLSGKGIGSLPRILVLSCC